MKYFIGIFLTLVLVGGGCERDAMREQKRVCEELGLGIKYVPAHPIGGSWLEEHIECTNK